MWYWEFRDKSWSKGITQGSEMTCLAASVALIEAVAGEVRTWGQGMVAAGSYTQITNHPVIQGITFAGSIE